MTRRMARRLLIVITLAGWAGFELATDNIGMFVRAQGAAYLAFEQITVGAAAVGFTAAKITPNNATVRDATQASCRVRTAEISFTIDNTTPTAAVGQLLEPGDYLTLNGHDVLVNFRAIRTTGTSGQLDCTYSAP